MEAALVISGLSLFVAIAALLWKLHTWRVARKTDVRVIARHDASGLDIFGAGSTINEHVIELQVFNHGEQPEYIIATGVKSASGEQLADDRPTAPKLVDDPAPVPREVPPRGQLAVKFRVPAEAIAQGFVGFADLATGPRVYSVPAEVDAGLIGIQSEIMKVVAESQGEHPSGPFPSA